MFVLGAWLHPLLLLPEPQSLLQLPQQAWSAAVSAACWVENLYRGAGLAGQAYRVWATSSSEASIGADWYAKGAQLRSSGKERMMRAQPTQEGCLS